MKDGSGSELGVEIDSEILERFYASLPRVVASRSRAWHVAWTSKLVTRLAFFAYSLYGLFRLHWSPIVLLAFLVAAVWTAWLCDLLAIWLGSRAWNREVNADSEHAFALQVHLNMDKPRRRIPASVLATGGPVAWGASLVMGGIATACIALFWTISEVSPSEAFRGQPVALALLVFVVVSQLVATLITARSDVRSAMAGLTTGGPLMRLLSLWALIFVSFVAAVNDLEFMRMLIAVLYAAGIAMTLFGLAAMPALLRESARLRARLTRAGSAGPEK